MAANSTFNSQSLIRQNVYANLLLPPIYPFLLSDTFILDVSSDFSDGDNYQVPLMGMPSIDERTENEPSKIDNISTSRFTMAVTEFPETAVGITRKLQEDGYATRLLEQQIVPAQRNAIMQRYETVLMNVQQFQTPSDYNLIDGVPHRFIGGGTNQVLTTDDFDTAAYALDTANIPSQGRVAIISPGQARQLKREIGQQNITFNRDFLGVPAESLRNGLDVTVEIGGFQVFVSNFVANVASETINGTTVTNGRAALFFSMADDYVKPIARAWRRMPTAEFYVDRPRDDMEVYRLNARFGVGLIRPQGLVAILAANPANPV